MAIIEKDKKTAELAQKSTTYGIVRNGVIDAVDYKKELTGARGIENYNKMRLGDATVKSSLTVCTLPILSAKWRIEPADQTRQSVKVADFVEECLFNDMSRSWQEFLNEALLFLVFGRMPFEIVYKFRPDGLIGLKKLSSIWPGSVWSWILKNGEDGIWQKTIDGDFETPIEKLVVFVNNKEGGNWEGTSILRSSFKHWYFKEQLYLIDVGSAERQGLGVPYAIKPDNSTADEDADMEEALKNMRANEKSYIMHKKGWEVGFLDMKTSSLKDLKFSIQHHERQITKNVLAQFLELGGTGGGGSWALSQDQSKLFLLSLEAVASYIRDNIQKYVIKKLVDYNFVVEKYPTIEYEKLGTIDYTKLITALTAAITAQVITPDEDLENYLRDVMDLPEFSGIASINVEDIQPMLDELDTEVNGLTNDGEVKTEPVEDPNNAGFDMDGNPMPEANTAGWTDSQWLKAAESLNVMIGAGTRSPMSDETKKKISEALKRSKASKGGSKAKGKGKKAVNPEVAKKQKEVSKLQKEAKEFNDSVRREVLEMKAKGQKLSPEDSAKKQLEWFDKKKTISDKVAKLKDEITTIKSATTATKETKPAKIVKKAHEHQSSITDESILKMSEELHNAINKVKKNIK